MHVLFILEDALNLVASYCIWIVNLQTGAKTTTIDPSLGFESINDLIEQVSKCLS